jgi:hypothetical protein
MPAANILPYQDLLQVRALRLTDDWASMQLYLVCDRDAAATPAIEELVAHLAAT